MQKIRVNNSSHIGKRPWFLGSFLLLIILLFQSSLLTAQPYPYQNEEHDFVKYRLNKITYVQDQQALDSFFGKMDHLLFRGSGQVSIVQIGGSHIQADMWSDRVRQNLQSFSPGNRSSRGFLFPFKMAETNNPYNYKPEFTGNWVGCRNIERTRDCTLGLSGISVTTQDSNAKIRIYFRGKDYPRYDFSTIKVFHNFDEAYSLRLDSKGMPQTQNHHPQIGYSEFVVSGYLDTLDLRIVKKNGQNGSFTLYGLSLENNHPGFVYHPVGVNGAAVPSYLRCKLFSPHLSVLNPDLVVLSIGINDAYTSDFSPERFERNYDSLVAKIRRAAPDCAILFTTNNDSYYKRRYPNRNAELVRKVMYRLAIKHHSAVWDMYGVMGGLGSVRTWQREGMARPDKIHFSPDGYRLVGDLMYTAIMQGYDDYLIRKSKP